MADDSPYVSLEDEPAGAANSPYVAFEDEPQRPITPPFGDFKKDSEYQAWVDRNKLKGTDIFQPDQKDENRFTSVDPYGNGTAYDLRGMWAKYARTNPITGWKDLQPTPDMWDEFATPDAPKGFTAASVYAKGKDPKDLGFWDVENGEEVWRDKDYVPATTTQKIMQGATQAAGKVYGNAKQGLTDPGAAVSDMGQSVMDEAVNPVVTGFQKARQGANVLAEQGGLQSPEAAAEGISAAEKATPPLPAFRRAADEQIKKAGSAFGVLGAYLSNPRAALAGALQGLTEGAASLGLSMGAGAAGGAAGGPVGALAGTIAGGAGGGYMDAYGQTIVDTLRQAGVDLTDKDAVTRALKDPDVMAAAQAAGRKAGIPAAVINAVSFGVAGKVYKAVAPAVGGTLGKAAGIAGEATTQGGIGAGGEAGRQEIQEGGITNPNAITAAGTSQAALGGAFAALHARGRPAEAQTKPEISPEQMAAGGASAFQGPYPETPKPRAVGSPPQAEAPKTQAEPSPEPTASSSPEAPSGESDTIPDREEAAAASKLTTEPSQEDSAGATALPAPETKAPAAESETEPATPDRRVDLDRRQRVDQMSPDEMRRELLTHELTGIPNRRAYEESEKLPVQASIDADSLKWVNDTGGHEAGDQVLQAIATALHDATPGNAFHISGDEFTVQGIDHATVDKAIADARARLADATVEFTGPDGQKITLNGIGFSHGKGSTLAEADANLQAEKRQREQTGLRAARGEQPPGSRSTAIEARLPAEESEPAAEKQPVGTQEVTDAETTPAEKDETESKHPDLSEPESQFVSMVSDRTIGKNNQAPIANITEARKLYGELHGRATAIADHKRVDELVERAVVESARGIVSEGDTPESTFDRLVTLYNRQPSLNTRTSTSIENQAYSTPAPLAHLASTLADIDHHKTVLEPTAGNGMLLIAADPAMATVNELNPDRAKSLEGQGFHVTQKDASAGPLAKDQDVIIANPPFGSVRGDDGKSKEFTGTTPTGKPYRTTQIDHAIVLQQLEAMKPDGRAVLLIGGVPKTASTPEARSDAYNQSAKRKFFYHLYNNYNVVDHFTVSGDLYSRQGAAWPIDAIVVHGVGKSKLPLPAAAPPRVYSSYADLKPLLGKTYEPNSLDARPETAGGAAGGGRGLPEPKIDETNLPAPSGRENPENGPFSAGSPGGGEGTGAGDVGGRTSAGRGELPAERSRGEADSQQLGSGGETDKPGRVSEIDESETPTGGELDGAPSPEGGSGRSERAPEIVGESDGSGGVGAQEPYQAASKQNALGTLVPGNMRDSIRKSLDTLERENGSADAFVAKEMGWKLQDVGAKLAAEQVDALALAIKQIKAGKGFIIGDQTGIGKGRVVASVIQWAIQHGHVPIFMTEKPKLYGDMVRDLRDIGAPDIRPLMTNAGEKVPLSETDPGDVLRSKESAQHNKILQQAVNEAKLSDHNMVFSTYDQMNMKGGKQALRHELINTLAPNAILILDESHNAGGTTAGRSNKKAGEEAGEKTGRAAFIRGLVGRSKGVFYSSATYAKRPDVMDLYFKTDMALAVSGDVSKLPSAIQAGGVPLQQVVASMLAESGQYIRRERSFNGVRYETPVSPVDRNAAEAISSMMLKIKEFDDLKQEAVKEAKKEAKRDAKQVSEHGATGAAGAQSTNFTSLMHNLISQMLLALKADTAADHAIEALKRGEKPVITVSNTMGSFIGEYAEQAGLKTGDSIKLGFKDLMNRYLESSCRIIVKDHDGKTVSDRRMPDEELGPAAVAAFNRAKKLIDSTKEIQELPVSPIDWIHKRLREEGYKTGEITGRDDTIEYRPDGSAIYKMRSEKDKSTAAKTRDLGKFNNGGIDAMILNRSGSTGLSMHASEKFKDQRQRHMIVAQAEGNIDTHMQMLGRIFRTGQVELPIYSQLVADIPAEKRPAAILAKKMASLNANTTGARGSALTAKDSVDFLNDYGDEVVAQLMDDLPEVHEKLGEPLGSSSTGGYDTDEAARKVTGRIPMLPVAEQEELYHLIETGYRERLAQADAMGENALEAKTLALDAKLVKKLTLTEGKKGESPFAEGSYAEVSDVKRVGKPFTAAEVREQLREKLGGVPESANLASLAAQGRQNARGTIQQTMADYHKYRAGEEAKMLENDTKEAAREGRLGALDGVAKRWQELAQAIHVGGSYEFQMQDGTSMYGVVTDVSRKKGVKMPTALGAWVAKIALADGARQTQIPFSKFALDSHGEATGKIKVSPRSRNARTGASIEQMFDDGQSVSREQRVIVTGNLLAGYSTWKSGQIVHFTDNKGNVRQGIMMPRSFKLEEAIENAPVKIAPDKAAQFLTAADRGVLKSTDGAVQIQRWGRDDFAMTVARSKAEGGKYFLDPDLRRLTGDFVSQGSGMRAMLNADQLGPALSLIERKFDQKFETTSHRKEALESGGEALGVKRGSDDSTVFEPTNAYAGKDLGVDSNDEPVKAQFKTRPDTTAADVRRGLSDLVMLRDRRAGAAVLGNAIPAAFASKGTVSLIGQRVGSIHDLALLQQANRRPDFEVLHLIFTKGDQVVHHTAMSSRLPGAAKFQLGEPGKDQPIDYVRAVMQAQGADGYWISHNHPSGKSQPSLGPQSDETFTYGLHLNVPGFKGHVVIDSHEYSTMTVNPRNPRQIDIATHSINGQAWNVGESAPRVPHKLLGARLDSPQALARIQWQIGPERGGVHVFAVSSNPNTENVRALTWFPKELVNYRDAKTKAEKLRVVARLRRVGIGSGGSWLFAIGDNAEILKTLPPIFQDVMVSGDSGTFIQDNKLGGRVPNLGRRVAPAYQVREVEKQSTFYSAVSRAVDAAKREKGTGPEWEATLRNMPGVKPEEMQWLGLKDWLQGRGRVTRAEVADYVKAHQIELREKLYGLGRSSDTDHMVKVWEWMEKHIDYDEAGFSMDDIDRRQEELSDAAQGDTQAIASLEAQGVPAELLAPFYDTKQGNGDVVDGAPRYAEYTAPGGKNYREMLLTLPIAKGEALGRNFKAAAEAYRSGHWNEPDVLVHARFDERQLPTGERTLHIAEIQSDWHHAGWDNGYKTPEYEAQKTKVAAEKEFAKWEMNETRKEAAASIRESEVPLPRNAVDSFLNPTEWAKVKDKFDPAVDTQVEKYFAAMKRFVELGVHQIQHESQVPNAPFKTTWQELALKRLLRHAVDKGFDALSWDTGQTVADRFSLSRRISSVHLRDSDFRAYGHNGELVYSETGMTPERVEQLIAKDAAEKLYAQPVAADGWRNLQTLDLNVGGEGKKAIYDKMLPSKMGKLVKPWGGKVERGTVTSGHATVEPDRNGHVVMVNGERQGGIYSYKPDAEAAAAKMFSLSAHVVQITPAMREGVSQGLPLFEPQATYGNSDSVHAPQGTYASGVLTDDRTFLGRPGITGKGYDLARRAAMFPFTNKLAMDVRKLVNPRSLSEESKLTAQRIVPFLADLARQKEMVLERFEQYSRDVDRFTYRQQLQTYHEAETGQSYTQPELGAIEEAVKKMLRETAEQVQAMGPGHLDHFIDNYLPHYYTDEAKAKKFFAGPFGRRPLKGPATFKKQRYYATMRDAMEKGGLKPLSANPLIQGFLKIYEMHRYMNGVAMARALKDDGYAEFFPMSKRIPEGWKEIDDPAFRVSQWSEAERGFVQRGRYAMPEDGARLLNNHLGVNHLANFSPAMTLRALANSMTMFQLGFSGFHLGFTSTDALISKNAIAYERLMNGEIGRAAAAFAEAYSGPVGVLMNLSRGRMLKNAYLDPRGSTPELQILANALVSGGGRIRMGTEYDTARGMSPFHGVGAKHLIADLKKVMRDPDHTVFDYTKTLGSVGLEYATKYWRTLKEIGRVNGVWGAPFNLLGRTVRASTAFIMDKIVPWQKQGAFMDMARDYLRRNPNATPTEVNAEMQKAWHSIDNRLGEVVYDNSFWNRSFKMAMHLSLRAVGWRFGTLQELGGGAHDFLKAADTLLRTGRLSPKDFTHKMAYLMALLTAQAISGALLQYALTGESPRDLKDLMFPRTGYKKKDGSDERLSIPTYMKDMYGYLTQPGHEVASMLNPILGELYYQIQGTDYWGDPLYDPNDSGWEQFLDRAHHFVSAYTPFVVENNQQSAMANEPGVAGAIARVGNFFGVKTAPKAITNPEGVAETEHYLLQKEWEKKLRYDLQKANQAGDKEEADRLRARIGELKAQDRKEHAEYMARKHGNAAPAAPRTQNAAPADDAKARIREEARQRRSGQTSQVIDHVNRLVDQGGDKEAIAARIHAAGYPALAGLIRAVPDTLRPQVKAKLAEYA